MAENKLSRLPKMDVLLARPELAECGLPYPLVRRAAREVLEEVRRALLAGEPAAAPRAEALARRALERARALSRPGPRRVVNATGVVLHTNLGRAPLSPRAAEAAAEAAGYCALEYDLETGRRGSRAGRAEALLTALTGAEGAFVVNNNAAAVLLMLSVLTPGLGVAISRGELVEIGGGFRVPDIMARSGARPVEVGSTNKTRPDDYAAALESGAAQALLKVHPSNFRMVGFTRSAELPELGALARARGALLLCDLGSGALSAGPFPGEPAVEEAAVWADVACFSGDKLLGGPQAGILIGKAALIQKIKADPLSRALRLDKLSLAALEGTLLDWRDGVLPPAAAMLGAGPEELRRRAEALAEALAPLCPPGCACAVAENPGEAGGGSMPGTALPGWAVALAPAEGPEELERFFRGWEAPVIGRIQKGRLLLDVRALLPGDGAVIAAALARWKEGAL